MKQQIIDDVVYHVGTRLNRPAYLDYIFHLATRAYAPKFIATTYPDGPPDVLLVMVAWGDRHIGLFLKVGLPMLLAPGNIPALAAGKRVTLRIFTSETSRAALEAAPVIAHLRRYASVSYDVVPDELLAYRPVTTWNLKSHVASLFGGLVHAGIHEATALKTDLIFIWPDQILGANSLSYLRRIIDRGDKDAMLVRAILVNETGFVDALRPYYDSDGILKLPTSRLVSLACVHMREESRIFFPQNLDLILMKNFNHLVIPRSEGVAIRQANPDPVFISRRILRPDNDYDYDPPDGRLTVALFPEPRSWSRIDLPLQGDDYFCCDIYDKTTPDLDRFEKSSLLPGLAYNLEQKWTDLERHLFSFKTIIHADEVPWSSNAEALRVDPTIDRIVARSNRVRRLRGALRHGRTVVSRAAASIARGIRSHAGAHRT